MRRMWFFKKKPFNKDNPENRKVVTKRATGNVYLHTMTITYMDGTALVLSKEEEPYASNCCYSYSRYRPGYIIHSHPEFYYHITDNLLQVNNGLKIPLTAIKNIDTVKTFVKEIEVEYKDWEK